MCGFFMGKNNLKNKISETANMPKDILSGLPILKMWGDSELYIENFRGLLEYMDTLIRLQARIGKIVIKGKMLQIEYYTNDDMKITGTIEMIEFQTEG